ncbi:class I SAM-dependent methyltransferase [Streptomyces huasconensis]|uniref:class I SAM-dependent methyltransferase n=1 Tax=Streptomyces huasconensis TaxID=1854574 RepID=UPI0036FF6ED5
MSPTTTPYAGASAKALAAHYDLPVDFYALWLDPSLTYSCALWDADADDLISAQQRKVDYLVAEARAAHADQVLDIGCGWGGTLSRLINHHHTQHATGLNLSPQQATWAQALKLPGVTVRNENWLDHQPTHTYDAIISIGAFEHFARPGMTPAAKHDAYRGFFTRCRQWLRPGGRLALQTITWGNRLPTGAHKIKNTFIGVSVFRESELPFPGEIDSAYSGLFRLVTTRQDGDHYYRTCQEWRRRLQDHAEEAARLVGSDTVERYDRYLDLSARLFNRRWTHLYRLTLEAVA